MDDGAWLVKEFGGMVWGTVYRIVGCEADAGDCFQETFVAGLAAGKRAGVREWGPYLRKVATAKGLDLLRKRVRRRGRERLMAEGEEVVRKEGGPGEAMERRELGERLRRALARVEPVQAEAFCLRHLSDMSYAEIGEVLGMKANAVGVMLMRVKGKLAEMLEELDVKEVRYEQR